MYSVFSRHDRGLDLHTDRINNGGQRSGTRRRGSDASSTFNTSRGVFATPRVAGYTGSPVFLFDWVHVAACLCWSRECWCVWLARMRLVCRMTA